MPDESPHCALIVETLRKRLLDDPVPSLAAIHVKPEAEEAMRFFATNNNFTGPVQAAFAELKKKLALG